MKYVLAGTVLLLIALPARFMFANHPNEYIYFNEFSGGIKKAFGNYELDYYMNSLKECTEWLKENENLKKENGKVMIASNNAYLYNYFLDDTAYVKTFYTRYYERDEKKCDYLILYCRFIDSDQLQAGLWPPEQTIYTSKVDGVPVSCVIKRTDQRLFEGLNEVKQNNFDKAIPLIEGYVKAYPNNETAWSNLGFSYLQTRKVNEAVSALSNSYRLYNDNPFTTYWLGIAYFQTGDVSNGTLMMDKTIKAKPDFPAPYKTLADYYRNAKDTKLADQYQSIYNQLTGAK